LLLPLDTHKEILALARIFLYEPKASEMDLFEFFHGFAGLAAGALTQIKIAVKQAFDNVDSIIFEAALTLNANETRNKQREYLS